MTQKEQLLLINDLTQNNIDILITVNTPMIIHIIKKYSSMNTNYEEYFSIGLEGLYKGIITFNCNKNTKLSSYLYTCINNAFKRKYNILNRKIYKNIIELTDIYISKPLYENYNEITILQQFILFIKNHNNIKVRLKKIFIIIIKLRFIYNISQYNLSIKLNCNNSTISLYLKKIKQLYITFLKENDYEFK